MDTKYVDVLIVNQIEGSQTGGFTAYDVGRPTYVETIAPTYLRSHFYHTFCAEAPNCLQLAAACRAAGLTVEVLDGMLMNLTADGLRDAMARYRAGVYSFSLFHSSYTAVVSLITALKARVPDAVVMTGGNYATLVYREILEKNPDIDYVLVGESDLSMPAFCHRIIAGESVEGIPGVAYRERREGSTRFGIRLTPPQVPHIDEVQPLARDYAQEILAREFSFSMVSSRGCGLGTCTFCYLPEYQRLSHIPKWRGKSPEVVVAEMEHLRDTYGVRHITFVDEDFIGPPKEGIARLVAFARLLVERKTNMTWYINALVISVLHLVREKHLPLLAEAGLRFLFVGIESGSDHILRRFKKGFTLDKLKEAVAALDEHGIRINPGLITFLPESTPEEVKANIDVIRLIQYYDVFVFTRRLVRLPGTEEGCGCAATDPKEQVNTIWLLPEEEYSRHMAIDVQLDPETYFQNAETRCIYAGLARYRDDAFVKYHELMRLPHLFSAEDRARLIRAHFQFFDDLYGAVRSGEIASLTAADAMAQRALAATFAAREQRAGELVG